MSRFAVVLADSDEDEVVVAAWVVEGESRFCGIIFFRIDSKPFSLVEVEATVGRDFGCGDANAGARTGSFLGSISLLVLENPVFQSGRTPPIGFGQGNEVACLGGGRISPVCRVGSLGYFLCREGRG